MPPAETSPLFREPDIPPEEMVPVQLDLILAFRQRNERVRIRFGNPEITPEDELDLELEAPLSVASALAHGALYQFVVYHERGWLGPLLRVVRASALDNMLSEADDQAIAMHARRHPGGLGSNRGYQYDGRGVTFGELALHEAATAITGLATFCTERWYADTHPAVLAIARTVAGPEVGTHRTPTECFSAFATIKE